MFLNKRIELPALVSLPCNLAWVIKLHPGDLHGANHSTGWKSFRLGCKLREHCHMWSKVLGSDLSLQCLAELPDWDRGTSEHPGAKGNRVIKSSLPSDPLATVTGEAEHSKRVAQVP